MLGGVQGPGAAEGCSVGPRPQGTVRGLADFSFSREGQGPPTEGLIQDHWVKGTLGRAAGDGTAQRGHVEGQGARRSLQRSGRHRIAARVPGA